MTEELNNVIEPQEFGEIDESLFEQQDVEKIDYDHIFGTRLSIHIANIARASSCSKEYILMNLLVLSSAIIGNKKKIKIWPGWDEPVHLWGALVGSPSCRKTASMNLFHKALSPLMDRRTKEYENLKSAYCERVKSIKEETKDKDIAKDLIAELRKPTLRQIIVNDTTVEAICRIIDEKKPECICAFRDEFSGFIKSLEKYNHGDKSFFIEGYGGRPYTINRVKNEEPIQLKKLSIALLGGIQPDKLRPILKDADDGFVSRFLFVFSEPQSIIPPEPGFKLDEELFTNLFDKLDLLPESVVSLSSEALETFKQWMQLHDSEKKYISSLLESSYGKFHGQLIRLACVLEHILRTFEGLEPPTEISNETMKKAIDLIEYYFKPMAAKIFCECGDFRKDTPSIRKLIKYLIDKKLDIFNWRTLVRRVSFKELGSSKELIIGKLIEANIIKEIPVSYSSSGGRPKSDYKINPKIRELKI